MLRQQKFLTEFLENIRSSSSSVLTVIQELRALITQPSNMVLYLAANLTHLKENPAKIVMDFLPQDKTPDRKWYVNIFRK